MVESWGSHWVDPTETKLATHSAVEWGLYSVDRLVSKMVYCSAHCWVFYWVAMTAVSLEY